MAKMAKIHMVTIKASLLKFISLFGRKKFTIVCYNEKEWNNIQYELFKRKYYWESCGKTIYKNDWNYPRILKNYRTNDIFGSKMLIIDSYNWLIKGKEIGMYNDIKTLSAKSYIRKIKLKKLNDKKNIL